MKDDEDEPDRLVEGALSPAPRETTPAEIACAQANAQLSAEIEVRKQIEEELRRRDRFLESIIENIPSMIFLKDARDLRFVEFNRAGQDLLGFSREDLIGKSDRDFFPPDEADFFIEKDREVLKSGALHEIPAEPIHTRHRGLRWLHTKKIAVRGEDGEPLYLLGISEDITERREAEIARRRAEEELRRSAEDLARSNAELEQFAYVASHDLQEPLRKIQAFSDLLMTTQAAALTDEGRDYLQRIVTASGRMRTLVQDLLTLSRVTSKARPFVAVDLALVAKEALTDLEVPIAETKARVEIGALPTLTADPAQMRQLFQNLLGNALKFRKDAGSPEIRVTAKVTEARAELSFADDGIGFDERYLDRIFKPFQRLNASSRYPGTGIGLAICRKIVERHGGVLTARSAPGRGSTFLVDLPLTPRRAIDGEDGRT
ncbi:MAG: ATP-binding protein [Polyangiaceae bacterium]